jgi:hypothetical protein
MTNTAIKYIRAGVKAAHGVLEGTMADVNETHAHVQPEGTAHSIAAVYAHVIISEDMIVAGMLKHTKPLMATTFAGKIGTSLPHPDMNADWEKNFKIWAKDVKVTLADLRKFAQAVYAATDEYLATLTDEDLEKPLDLSALGMGQVTTGYIWDRFIVGHTDNITGEIAVLKGLQGLKGYPF